MNQPHYHQHVYPIEITNATADWAVRFQQESALIQTHCSEMIVDIAHIGSTAVDDLPAKSTVDIMVRVPDKTNAQQCVAQLTHLGYVHVPEFKDGLPGRYEFMYKDQDRTRWVNLHIAQINGGFDTKHLAFRNALRAQPNVAQAYGELKQTLAKQHPYDMDAYNDGKTDFIMAVLVQEGW